MASTPMEWWRDRRRRARRRKFVTPVNWSATYAHARMLYRNGATPEQAQRQIEISQEYQAREFERYCRENNC